MKVEATMFTKAATAFSCTQTAARDERARLIFLSMLPVLALCSLLAALLPTPLASTTSPAADDFDYASSFCGGPPGVVMMANADGRPTTIVTPVSSEALGNGKRITTLFVRFPPRSLTPKHVHGGAVNAYILKGTVRSQLAGQQVRDFKQGEVIFEPVGSIHLFAENPSTEEWAELLAVIVHDAGAPLTTFIE